MCHLVLLDASRAFDRVNYIKLFRLLISRRMCPTAISLLLTLYTGQSMHVSWNGTESRSFSCSNGVKQGGVLSPLLFCVYVDELLVRLQSLNCGCYIGNSFVGAFGYADDLSLLAPSLVAAKLMLSVCEDFSMDYDVMFNAGKSGHLVFHNAPVNLQTIDSLSLNGVMIPKVESALLLGTNIGSGKVVHDFSKAVGEMTYRTNH